MGDHDTTPLQTAVVKANSWIRVAGFRLTLAEAVAILAVFAGGVRWCTEVNDRLTHIEQHIGLTAASGEGSGVAATTRPTLEPHIPQEPAP